MRVPTKPLLVLTAAAMLAAGCSSGSSSTSPPSAADDKSIEIWTSLDPPVMAGLEASLAPLAKAAGIEVTWSRVDNINQLIVTKVQAKAAPDIAFIPQPGVVADLVKRNAIVPLDDAVDLNALKASMVPGTLEAGTVDGKLYGLLTSMNVKSLVFYPKKAWAAAGYTAPTTIDELNALTDKIRATGTAPWCMGIESGAATGWAATDWFEDLVMRYGDPAQYNDWVSHKILFDSPLVRQAAAEFEKIAFTDGNVLGGRKSITSNNFGTAGNPMFDAKPGCMMYKQGSFITGFFPESATADLDANVGVFGFPPATEGGPNPVLGGGDLSVLMNDSSSAKKVMGYLSETDIGNDAVAEPGSSFISPHTDFDASLYPNDVTRSVADVAYNSSAFLFDGSDQMPGEVGAGSFWKEMTAWISGQEDLDTALQKIDDSWPS
jgi:alpha-glucoside transport system substrate-binding protein